MIHFNARLRTEGMNYEILLLTISPPRRFLQWASIQPQRECYYMRFGSWAGPDYRQVSYPSPVALG